MPQPTADWRRHFTAIDTDALIAGRYRLLARLGTGGAGVVFKAADREREDMVVAMKILSPLDFKDPTARVRFEKEVTLTRDFQHPNVVQVFDFGETETGQSFITMEFVDGGTLTSRIYDNEAPLAFSDTLRILHDVAQGVAFAHRHGVVHRDLKPDNILLTCSGTAKVADFGLAREMATGHTITKSGDTVGTPYYMAPEQFRHHRVDGKADMYSLGIIAYEMANRKRPFAGELYQQIAMAHIQTPMQSFWTKESDIPKWFETFVLICTEKDPERRFSSMDDLLVYLRKKLRKLGLLEGGPERESFIVRLLAKLLGEE